jgi:hypothetical protein
MGEQAGADDSRPRPGEPGVTSKLNQNDADHLLRRLARDRQGRYQPASRARILMIECAVHLPPRGAGMALRTVAQCGVVSLELLQVLYNAKFELLGINADMLALRKGL